MTLARDVDVMGPNRPFDWEMVVEAVIPLLLYGLVFVIGIQLLISEWLDRPTKPRFPDDPGSA